MKFIGKFKISLLVLCAHANLCLAFENVSALDLGGGMIAVPKYTGSENYLLFPYPTISYSWNHMVSLSLVEGLKIKYYSLPYVSLMVTVNHKGKVSESDIGSKPGIWKATESISYKAPCVSPMLRFAHEVTDSFVGAGTYVEMGLSKNIYSVPDLFVRFELTAQYSDKKRMQRLYGVSNEISIEKKLRETYYSSSNFESINGSSDAEYELFPDWFLQSNLNYRYLLVNVDKSGVVKTEFARNQVVFALGVAYRTEFL